MNSNQKNPVESFRPKKKRVDGLTVFAYFMLAFWSFLIIFVLGLAVMFSMKSSVELFQNPWSLPTSFATIAANFKKAWFTSSMGRFLLNSVMIISVSLTVTLLTSAMASYVLTRFKFPGNRFLMTLLITGMGVPIQLLLIPLYKLVSSMGLADSYVGLVIVYSTSSIPFTAYVLSGFFSSIPSDVIDSALIDGASQHRLFWSIVMPLAKPGLIAVTSFNFTWVWNEYMIALVLTSKKTLRTISLGMYALQGSMTYTVDWGALFAGVVIMLIPATILFVLLNKYIISGVTVGAVKG